MINVADASSFDRHDWRKLTQMAATLEQIDLAIAWINCVGNVDWCNANFAHLLHQTHPLPANYPLVEGFPLYRQGESIPSEAHPLTRALTDEPIGKEYYEWHDGNQRSLIEVAWSPLVTNDNVSAPIEPLPAQSHGDRLFLFVVRPVSAPIPLPATVVPHCHPSDFAIVTAATPPLAHSRDPGQRLPQHQILQDSAEHLHFALESADIGLWSWDVTTGQEVWSPRSEILFGFVPGTFTGTTALFMERVHPDDHELIRQAHSQAFQTGIYRCEFRVILPGGMIRWLVSKGRVFYDEAGNPTRVSGIDMDITERKQVEAALRRQKEHLRLILDNIPQQVFWKDHDLVFQGCNKHWAEAAFLSSPDAVVGKTDYDLLPNPDVAKSFREQDRQIMTSNTPQLHHIATKQRPGVDGRTIWLDISKIPMHDASGRVIGILGVLDDITQRVVAEEQLKASLQEKEVLLKEIHHRVKNNLQMVFSLLNLQSSAIQDEAIQNVLKDTQSRVKAMALIHEKLYQSKSLSKIRLTDYIRQLTVDLLQSYRTQPLGIDLMYQIDDLEVSIDTMIPCGLIIGELVANAIKYAFPNGRAGWIRISFLRDNTLGYILEVSDNGIGIPESIDFRDTKSLGLQLVCAFVHQLRGIIDLDRANGSLFRITFRSLL